MAMDINFHRGHDRRPYLVETYEGQMSLAIRDPGNYNEVGLYFFSAQEIIDLGEQIAAYGRKCLRVKDAMAEPIPTSLLDQPAKIPL